MGYMKGDNMKPYKYYRRFRNNGEWSQWYETTLEEIERIFDRFQIASMRYGRHQYTLSGEYRAEEE